MGLVMVHHTTEKNPSEVPYCNTSFSSEIRNDRHYTGVNVNMDLVLEVSDLEKRFMCHFQLKEG